MNKLAGTSNLQYQFQRFGKEEFILVSIISYVNIFVSIIGTKDIL